jgi:hypothetical protein
MGPWSSEWDSGKMRFHISETQIWQFLKFSVVVLPKISLSALVYLDRFDDTGAYGRDKFRDKRTSFSGQKKLNPDVNMCGGRICFGVGVLTFDLDEFDFNEVENLQEIGGIYTSVGNLFRSSL